jgi:hypothetical protein
MWRTSRLTYRQRWKGRVRTPLDENFPLKLVRKLREANHEVEHIILLGKRGTPDSVIRNRLRSEEILFLTTEQEFLSLPLTRSSVIVSRVAQNLPIAVRVEIWFKAIQEFFSRAWEEKLFEVFDDGRLRPWQDLPISDS